jgi:hypothetical protein
MCGETDQLHRGRSLFAVGTGPSEHDSADLDTMHSPGPIDLDGEGPGGIDVWWHVREEPFGVEQTA